MSVQALRRCPKCGALTERVDHCFVKGPPLFPQMDDYTVTVPCDVVDVESVVKATMDAQAELQVALGWLRCHMSEDLPDIDPAKIEYRLAKSLALSHKLLGELGTPMAEPATHPEVELS